MTRRKGTQPHEVVSPDLRTVIVGDASRTHCAAIARAMNKGVPRHRHVLVRPERRPGEAAPARASED